jgi:hypothetical protein
MGMSQQIINVGSSPNDGSGDPIRTAFIKTNANFAQLFALPNPTPPVTLLGKTGDVAGMYAYDSNYFYYCFGTYNGSTVIWAKVAQIGDISVANLINGTSNVTIASANANVSISVNATPNIAVFSTNGLSITGNIEILRNITANGVIIANGNVRGGNFNTNGSLSAAGNIHANAVIGLYLFGDGSNISNISGGGGNYSNANVANFLPIYSGNISAGNISTADVVHANGNIITDGYFIGNFAGNISGNLVVPGSNTQVLYNNNGNAGASSAFVFNYGANILSVAGNIQSNYFLGNGSQLTGLPLTYGNANVANFLPVFTGNITAKNISVTGNITGNYLITTGININGNISTSGNVNGSYILGNGSQLTGIVASNISANTLTGSTLSSNVTLSSLTSVGTLANLSVNGNVVASGIITSTGTFRLPSYTTTQIANLSAIEGDMVYNSTLKQIQGYQANATGNVTWVSLSVSTYQ